MNQKKEKKLFVDPNDGEYIGNVFGWKTSLISGGVILLFIAFYYLASYQNKKDPNFRNIEEYENRTNQEQTDSSLIQ